MNNEPCPQCPARSLTRSERRAIIEATLRSHPHESSRAIASRLGRLGVDPKTVEKVRSFLVSTGEIPHLEKLLGRDGKRRRKPRTETIENPVYTSHRGLNADLIADVARLYFQPGDKIADVTFGKGNFWNKLDLSPYEFFPSDAVHEQFRYDFRALPYQDESLDVVVFDPPYVTHEISECKTGYRGGIQQRYNSVAASSPEEIRELYEDGIREAYRILVFGGVLVCKCMDFSRSTGNHWQHIDIFNFASSLGFEAADLFVLTTQARLSVSGREQDRARKNHSFLWVFEKA